MDTPGLGGVTVGGRISSDLRASFPKEHVSNECAPVFLWRGHEFRYRILAKNNVLRNSGLKKPFVRIIIREVSLFLHSHKGISEILYFSRELAHYISFFAVFIRDVVFKRAIHLVPCVLASLGALAAYKQIGTTARKAMK